MSHILITGGAGFIGSHTADALLAKGHQVRILDLLDPQVHGHTKQPPTYLHPNIEFIHGDVRDPRDLQEALQGIDVVYHLASLTGVGQSMYAWRDYVDTNCTGTAALLQVILQNKLPIKRFILASSRAVYGEGSYRCGQCGPIYPKIRQQEDMAQGFMEVYCPTCQDILTSIPTEEERPLQPTSVYGWTKKHQEELCQQMASTLDSMRVICLRYFNVYGSRQSLQNPYTGVVSVFYSRLMAGQPIHIYEHGKPIRDFVHISDVVQANLLSLKADVKSGSCFNVGTGESNTIWQIADSLAKACRRSPTYKDLGEYRVGDIYACYSNLQKAQEQLNYKPTMKLEDGMYEFAQWAHTQTSTDLYAKTVRELNQYGLFGKAA